MEGDEKAAEKIKTEVKDNTLKIPCEEPTFNLDNLKIYITVKDLKKIELSGAGDLKAFKLETKKAVVKTSGAGDAKANVKE